MWNSLSSTFKLCKSKDKVKFKVEFEVDNLFEALGVDYVCAFKYYNNLHPMQFHMFKTNQMQPKHEVKTRKFPN